MMKRLFFCILLLMATTLSTTLFAQTQETYTREGNNFTKVTQSPSSQDVLTKYTYTIKEGVYPIYITKNGRCYIVRISKKGNEYKQYLKEKISRQICSELGVEYKEFK